MGVEAGTEGQGKWCWSWGSGRAPRSRVVGVDPERVGWGGGGRSDWAGPKEVASWRTRFR